MPYLRTMSAVARHASGSFKIEMICSPVCLFRLVGVFGLWQTTRKNLVQAASVFRGPLKQPLPHFDSSAFDQGNRPMVGYNSPLCIFENDDSLK